MIRAIVRPFVLGYYILAMSLGQFFWPVVLIVLGLLAAAGGLGYFAGKFL